MRARQRTYQQDAPGGAAWAAALLVMSACVHRSGDQPCVDRSSCPAEEVCVAGRCLNPCVDSSACVPELELCVGGVCWPQAPPCSADADCTTPSLCDVIGTGVCDDGRCSYQQRPAGSRCDDGQGCTYADSCDAAGACVGTSVLCDQEELVAHYPLDAVIMNQVADVSGAGLHGACNDTSCPDPALDAPSGQGLSFNGAGDALVIPADPALDTTTAFTAAIWVRLRVAGCSFFARPFGLAETANSWEFSMYDERLGFFSNGPGFTTLQSPIGSVPLAVWHHTAVTFDGTTIRIYLNGAEVASGAGVPAFGDGPLVIGADMDEGTLYGFLDGDLDDARIYGRALSPLELAQLADAGG